MIGEHRHPLDEARDLRELADKAVKGKTEEELYMPMTDVLASIMYMAVAEGLERGYRLGRIMAAFDVRMGMDKTFGQGSVHFDSDTAPPPAWIMGTAEKLARGDA